MFLRSQVINSKIIAMALTSICLFLLAIRGAYTLESTEAECRIVYDKYDYQAAASRNFLFGEVWPDSKIPYQLGPGFSNKNKDLILSAMRHIEGKTCVKWVPRNGEFNHVYIKNDEDGCWANLGYNRLRGRHELNLQRQKGGRTCMKMGTAAHEMLHLMGFAHEQTRPDRDQYVKILWSKIRRDAISNYFRAILVGSSERPPICDPRSQQSSFDNCYSGFRTETFGLKYDFGSIMHYGLSSFTVSGEDTMRVLAPVPVGVKIGNREGMTDLDAAKAQAKYGCNGKTTTTRKPSVECKDKYIQCQSYKRFCGRHAQITKGCPVSCGQCKECSDKYTNCPQLSNLCGGDDDIDARCKLSCGTC